MALFEYLFAYRIFLADEEELRHIVTLSENAVEGTSRLETHGHYIAVTKPMLVPRRGYQPKEMIVCPGNQPVHPEESPKN
jgi:hypothetical protein